MTNPFETLRDMGPDAPLLYMITTGAGAGLQEKLWQVPGVSNFFVGATMPYSTEETAAVLGYTPEKYVSVETAIDLAMTAYMRAWVPGRKAIGLGMTCSVASTKAHRGAHRVIAAVFTDTQCLYVSAEIPKGEGAEQRKIDGRIADEIGFQLLSYAACYEMDLSIIFSEGSKLVELQMPAPTDGMERARTQVLAHPYYQEDSSRKTIAEIQVEKIVFFPGAFNPPHSGHFESGQKSQETVASKEKQFRHIVFSTTVNPPHKAALTVAEMLQRARMMRGHDFLLTESDPLYLHKARKFPGAYFVMGADAMDRFLDERWGEPIRPMLDEFATLGTRFLVPGRLVNGEYMTCGRVMSKHMANVLGRTSLFIPVDFRLDLSSTELRARVGA